MVQDPDKTLENALRQAGIPYACCWEIEGPEHTGIAWMTALAVRGLIMIIQTHKSGGWEVYLPVEDATI